MEPGDDRGRKTQTRGEMNVTAEQGTKGEGMVRAPAASLQPGSASSSGKPPLRCDEA